MTFQELLAETRLREVRESIALKAWHHELEAVPQRSPGLRRAVASALVRAGVWIDRGAGDRFAVSETTVAH